MCLNEGHLYEVKDRRVEDAEQHVVCKLSNRVKIPFFVLGLGGSYWICSKPGVYRQPVHATQNASPRTGSPNLAHPANPALVLLVIELFWGGHISKDSGFRFFFGGGV